VFCRVWKDLPGIFSFEASKNGDLKGQKYLQQEEEHLNWKMHIYIDGFPNHGRISIVEQLCILWYTYIGISQLAMDFPHSTFPIKARCLNAERLRADGIPGNHLIQGITGQSIWVAPEMGFQDGETYGSKTCETYREYSMGVLTYIYIYLFIYLLYYIGYIYYIDHTLYRFYTYIYILYILSLISFIFHR